ncbi:hypothetical protein CIL03_09455 [Virgibacillus indicus]|uniref:Uncharacterized protein n=1 Tax=Virgibacillus indicus TaxID=2024554 RepID=A0A265N939_9BACI|nr:hypothetical protein [Virgibacillus indicus]OZU88522.1 hypothetical protein CIL03_09455 [Virgibacillus indicus]
MNQAFRGLYFKEWKMMKGFFIGPFVITIILILLLNVTNDAPIINTISGLMAFGYIILPAAVIFSLNSEVNHLELFLHNPQSVHLLLIVKFLNGILCAFTFLVVLSLSLVSIDMIWESSSLTVLEMFSYLLLIMAQMIIVSIYPAVILFFFWTLHQIWRTYIGGLSIFAVVALLIFSIQMMSLFRTTAIYKALTDWGAVSISVNSGYSGEFLALSFGMFQFNGDLQSIIHLGPYVFYGIITVLLYFISAYLLDRKVEV